MRFTITVSSWAAAVAGSSASRAMSSRAMRRIRGPEHASGAAGALLAILWADGRGSPAREAVAEGPQDSRQAEAPQAAALADRSGAGRRWLHRRCLRDRRPAGARPAGGEPDRQPVRRI